MLDTKSEFQSEANCACNASHSHIYQSEIETDVGLESKYVYLFENDQITLRNIFSNSIFHIPHAILKKKIKS